MSVQCAVELGDVGRVVLTVVDAHRPFVDMRGQGIKAVGQVGKLVRHQNTLLHKWDQETRYNNGCGKSGWHRNDVIERVPLDRVTARHPDQPTDILGTQRLRGAGAGHVVDLLFLDGPVQVIHAEPE